MVGTAALGTSDRAYAPANPPFVFISGHQAKVADADWHSIVNTTHLDAIHEPTAYRKRRRFILQSAGAKSRSSSRGNFKETDRKGFSNVICCGGPLTSETNAWQSPGTIVGYL